MDEFRNLIDESPDIIQEALINNRNMPEMDNDRKYEMDENLTKSRESNTSEKSDYSENPRMDIAVKDKEDNIGLLEGFINKIKALFQ